MKYQLNKNITWNGTLSKRVLAVMKMFGLDMDRLQQGNVGYDFEINLDPAQICFISGPSGAGKSLILRDLYEMIPAKDRIDLNEIKLDRQKSLIDCLGETTMESLRFLSQAGLNDIFTVLNQPANLSEGQKYRFRLAAALASERKFIFADEFCTNLDRLSAMVIASRIRKIAARLGITFILASSNDDMLTDLAPDVFIVKGFLNDIDVIYLNDRENPNA
jgi:ABC-type ATPase with predicted acetyltransferase domain